MAERKGSRAISVAVALIIVSFFMAGYLYYSPVFPERVVSHWNGAGEANGEMGKFWGLFLMPVIGLAMLVVFLLIPLIDPLKKNIEKFRKSYNLFILVLILFLFYVYLLSIAWNLGARFNFSAYMSVAFGFLFFYLGTLIEKTKRNFFIGIRTPWTLSSDKVWDKTHKLGGLLFKISGVIALLGIFAGKYSLWFVIVPVIVSALVSVVYSYLVWRK